MITEDQWNTANQSPKSLLSQIRQFTPSRLAVIGAKPHIIFYVLSDLPGHARWKMVVVFARFELEIPSGNLFTASSSIPLNGSTTISCLCPSTLCGCIIIAVRQGHPLRISGTLHENLLTSSVAAQQRDHHRIHLIIDDQISPRRREALTNRQCMQHIPPSAIAFCYLFAVVWNGTLLIHVTLTFKRSVFPLTRRYAQ